MDQIIQTLKTDFFELIFVPIIVTFATAIIKICSKDVRARAFEAADIAGGFDLYIAAIVSLLTFLIIVIKDYKPVDTTLPQQQVITANEANQKVLDEAVITGGIAFGLTFFLLPIIFVYSRLGWKAEQLQSGQTVYEQRLLAIWIMLLLGCAVYYAVSIFIGEHLK